MIDFAKQFEEGAKAAEDFKVSGHFERVILCGMGGSAIPGEMISMLWLPNFNCYLQRGFGLPFWAGAKSLVLCTSWSGNTQESIFSFKAAIENGIPVVAITKGGELAKLAQVHGTPLVILPNDSAPSRLGVGYMLAALLTLLNNSAIIDFKLPGGHSDSNSVAPQLRWVPRQELKPSTGHMEPSPVGPSFSSRIGNKFPLIYSSYQWRYLARFWKIHFNESSKVHSFSNYFPEAAHNEIAGFTAPVPTLPWSLTPSAFGKVPPRPFVPKGPSNLGHGDGQLRHRDDYFPIILIDPDEDQADRAKLEKFVSFLKGQKIDHQVVEINGSSRLEKILNNYNLAISISFELAKSLGVDPLDAMTIDGFKKA